MTPDAPLTFGGTPGQEPLSVIVAMRGGWPQSVEKGWAERIIPNFLDMSQLDALASPTRVVLMPDDRLPIYGMGGVRAINHYLAPYGNAKRYFFGFSKGGSGFVETWSKHIKFDAAVIWSAVNPPTERDETPRIPTRVIVVYGSKEKCSMFGLRSCRETSIEVAKAFEDSGSQVRIWSHDLAGPWIIPGHTWAPEYNSRIVDHLEIP